jgi:beta-fructofuranosidase
LDGGKNSSIATFFPEGNLDTLEITTSGIIGGAQVSVGVWGLKDAWAAEASPDGIVYGNVTTGGHSTTGRRATRVKKLGLD